jgi:hypothetical protein
MHAFYPAAPPSGRLRYASRNREADREWPADYGQRLSQGLLVSQTPLIAFLDASNHFFDA